MTAFQRWYQFSALFLYMLLLGSVYTYSVYRPFIIAYYDVRYAVSGFPYMLSLALFAISMYFFSQYFAGQYIKRLILLGTLFVASGFSLAAIASNITLFSLGYGVLVGTGVGIIYGLSLNIITRIFNQRIGLLSGLILMAFGLSSVVGSPIAQWFLSTYSLANWFWLFVGLSITIGVLNSFGPNYDPQEIVKREAFDQSTIPFILLFIITSFIGLMMIGISGVIGTQIYQFDGPRVAYLTSIFAIGNAAARPLFGQLMDKLGFWRSALIVNGLIVLATGLNLINQGNNFVVFGIGYFLYWFSLGSWLAIMPMLVKQKFGTERYASVYGRVFIGYGIAAVAGTLFSGLILDILQATFYIYVGIMLLLILATLLSRRIATSI